MTYLARKICRATCMIWKILRPYIAILKNFRDVISSLFFVLKQVGQNIAQFRFKIELNRLN